MVYLGPCSGSRQRFFSPDLGNQAAAPTAKVGPSRDSDGSSIRLDSVAVVLQRDGWFSCLVGCDLSLGIHSPGGYR